MCGDVHQNPGPKNSCNLSISHWNLNSISAHNFIKLVSLEAYNSIFKYDLICLSETYLDSSFAADDISLTIKGYNLIRADHPLNIKRGGACVYYKNTLPIKILNISQLPECLVVEILYDNKKCLIVSLYRSLSQNSDDFDSFLTKFGQLIDSIYDLDPYFLSFWVTLMPN